MKNPSLKTMVASALLCVAGCQPYQFPVTVSGIVHEANQRKIEKRKSEIGDVIVFEIRARVRTAEGVQEKTERVHAKIIGHREFAGSVERVFESEYQHGGKLVFKNSRGKTLVIRSRKANQLGAERDGGMDHWIGGYVDGKFVSVKELRSSASMERHSFVLESYVAPEIR